MLAFACVFLILFQGLDFTIFLPAILAPFLALTTHISHSSCELREASLEERKKYFEEQRDKLIAQRLQKREKEMKAYQEAHPQPERAGHGMSGATPTKKEAAVPVDGEKKGKLSQLRAAIASRLRREVTKKSPKTSVSAADDL